MIDANDLRIKFTARFGGEPQLFRAPGRVNLIGDHTDYNEGFVLPAAIDFFCYAAISPRQDNSLTVFSRNFDESVTVALDEPIVRGAARWSDYALGVFRQLQREGYSLRGANLYISSDVPIGAGLSSSAAVEVSVAYALLGLAGCDVDPPAIAKLCREAENDFVGAKCGIMDQFASCCGRASHALFLDCRSLQRRGVRVPDSLRIVICNTMITHSLGSPENAYNARRADCEEGVRQLSRRIPGIRALRDVTPGDLERNRSSLNEVVYKRCRHVIAENERVREMALALEQDDRQRINSLMLESHSSLRDDYEVRCPELDWMVRFASQQRGVCGARMTGAGFGGCTVNLVEAESVADFKNRMIAAYAEKSGRVPEIYVCEAVDGAGRAAT